jgi:hypothetical protein
MTMRKLKDGVGQMFDGPEGLAGEPIVLFRLNILVHRDLPAWLENPKEPPPMPLPSPDQPTLFDL